LHGVGEELGNGITVESKYKQFLSYGLTGRSTEAEAEDEDEDTNWIASAKHGESWTHD
jgi:hypothetical protein